MENVKDVVVEYLEREYKLPDNVDLDSFNYLKTGYVDSIGVIQFISMLEDEFDIEFSDEELAEEKYQIAGEMVKLIEEKIKARSNG